MGFDPGSQFSLQLIQSLGQQIGEGQQRVRENQVLEQILPQIQQAQEPQQILNSILQLQTVPGLRPETRQQALQAATPAFNLARENVKQRQNLNEFVAKEDLQRDQKRALAEQLRNNGVDISDEQADRLPLSSLEKQFEKSAQLKKEETSKTFKDNFTFQNKVFEDERKSFDQSRLVQQARDASANFNAAAGALGRAFPAAKGSPQAVFDTSVGLLIENFTKLFPGRISDVKFKFLQTLLPLASQRQDVRDSILDVLQDLAETPALTAETLRSLQKQNPDILRDPNMTNLMNQELAIKFNEIDSKLDQLNQFQAGQEQEQDLLDDPRVLDIVQQLRAQGIPDEDIRRALQS